MKLIKILIFAMLVISSYSYACTSSLIHTQEDGWIYLRSLQFAMPVHSNIIAIPRNYEFVGATANNQHDGVHWKTKYAVIGMNALGADIVADGINEEGLVGGILNFPKYGKYQTMKNDNEKSKAIAGYQLLTWILTNFKNTDEVKAHLKDILVVATPISGTMLYGHYTIHDANGKSIVIEYDTRGLKIYNNPLHVMTNSPSFDHQMVNFGQYIYLTNQVGDSVTINNHKFTPDSTGWASIGLPGGFDSMSRFIRATFITNNINNPKAMPKTQSEGVLTAFRVLNTFDFPLGVDANEASFSPTGVFDINEWVSVADLKNKQYFIKTYNDSSIRMLSFSDFDLNGSKINTYDVNSTNEKIYSLKPFKK